MHPDIPAKKNYSVVWYANNPWKRDVGMTSKKIMIRDIGEITLERSYRARRIRLSIRPFKGVRVAVPQGVPFDNAEKVVLANTDWLKKHLKKIAALERETRIHEKTDPIDHDAAKEKLVRRVHELSKQHAFTYNKIFVKNQKTRWGSCSNKNNINLNVNLMRLPEHLIDYTILHELVHTRVKNHGKQFWSELEKYIPGAKRIDKELNHYRVDPQPPARQPENR